MQLAQATPKLSLLGTSALLFEAPGDFELVQQQRIWALADRVRDWPGVLEAVPGVTNLMVAWHEPPEDIREQARALQEAWATVEPKTLAGRTVEIPVVYGGAFAIDLEAVGRNTGMSLPQIAELHSSADYTVCAVGSAPGFGYLHGLDPRLACPRKAVPTLHVPAGAVTIGGMQTGVSVVASPNGWNVIGEARTRMFDVTRERPSLLAAGDRVRFVIDGIDA